MDQSPQECEPVPRLEPVLCSGRRSEKSLFRWIMSSRWRVILLASSLVFVPLVWAQEASKGGKREGDLQTFINPEAIDLNIETPLLIHATTFDTTVPIQLHTERLIDALKARGKDFEAKIYDRAPGGHGFSQGDTEPSRDSANRIFAFLGKHLKP